MDGNDTSDENSSKSASNELDLDLFGVVSQADEVGLKLVSCIVSGDADACRAILSSLHPPRLAACAAATPLAVRVGNVPRGGGEVGNVRDVRAERPMQLVPAAADSAGVDTGQPKDLAAAVNAEAGGKGTQPAGDANAPAAEGETAHQLSTESILQQEYMVSSIGDGPATPLHFAAWCGHDAIVTMLLGAGASVNQPTAMCNDTPLGSAVFNEHISTMKVLLQAGADPNVARFEDKLMVLHLAVEIENVECVAALLEHGADPNALATKDSEALVGTSARAPTHCNRAPRHLGI